MWFVGLRSCKINQTQWMAVVLVLVVVVIPRIPVKTRSKVPRTIIIILLCWLRLQVIRSSSFGKLVGYIEELITFGLFSLGLSLFAVTLWLVTNKQRTRVSENPIKPFAV